MTIEKPNRITSIDLLRGLIMVVMAIDHCRDFLHFDAWVHDPTDFKYTTPFLFLTRWITHFCAPNFILLAGLSAYLYGLKKGGSELTKFLVTRGLWLILLEFTLFRFLWSGDIYGKRLIIENAIATHNLGLVMLALFYAIGMFNLHFTALVIWAIGMSMVFLAFWRKLPYSVILISGLLIVLLHNLTDAFNPDSLGIMDAVGNSQSANLSVGGIIWAFLHRVTPVTIGPVHVFVLYPLLPYFGLICLGYCLGKFYAPTYAAESRQRNLILLGVGSIALFIVLRLFNIYGDPSPFTPFTNLWSTPANITFSILSFINTTKYPCSLLYILMTVGPALIFLAMVEKADNVVAHFFITIGKVPMFYYILHLILINLTAFAIKASHIAEETNNRVHLSEVYIAWAFVVFSLYFVCKWYGKYKAAHPEKWWLSYL